MWKRELNDEKIGRRHGEVFRPVRLPQKSATSEVTLRCPGGFEIEVTAQTGEAALLVAIRAVKQCG